MQKSSWIALGVLILLSAFLGVGYIATRPAPETLTKEQATTMLTHLQKAAEGKNTSAILGALAPMPEGKYAELNREQLQWLLNRAFRGSERIRTEITNVTFDGGMQAATLAFDLVVYNGLGSMTSENYRGRITLSLKRVEVPRFGGILKSFEWRIVKADTTGPNLTSFGDL